MDSAVQVQVLSSSVGIGMIVSVLTQVLKFTEKIPGLSKIPLVQKLIDVIDRGNIVQIRTFVAVLCVAINAGSLYYTQGTPFDMMALYTSFVSFWTALGTYDLLFSGDHKDA